MSKVVIIETGNNIPSDLNHISTSIIIASDKKMENILHTVTEEVENKNEYRYTLPNGIDRVYVKLKLHFENNTSGWSRVAKVDGVDSDDIENNIIIKTPKVETTLHYIDNTGSELEIHTNSLQYINGGGEHTSTTYKILDSDNKEIWSSIDNKVHKNTIVANGFKIEANKLYQVLVSHKDRDGNKSYYGKSLLSTMSGMDRLYMVKTTDEISKNRWMYFKVFSFIRNLDSIDLWLVDNDGKTVSENLKQDTKTPSLYTGDISVGLEYRVMIRLNYNDGSVSPGKEVMSGVCTSGLFMELNPELDYNPYRTSIQNIINNGPTILTTSELFNGTILTVKHNDQNLYRNVMIGGKLTELNISYIFEDKIEKPNMAIIPLYNGRVLINHSLIEGEEKDVSKWVLLEYNTATNEMNKINETVITDERDSVGENGAYVDTRDGYLWYIPSYIENGDTIQNNEIRRLNVITLESETMKVLDTLPVNRDLNLISYTNDRMLITGGTTRENDFDYGELITRENSKVYVYDMVTDTLTEYDELTIPNSIYSLSLTTLKNGKVGIFNNSLRENSKSNQDIYVYDVVNKDLETIHLDNDTDLAYTNMIKLRDGNILRISSDASGIQDVLSYPVKTSAVTESTVTQTSDLIVSIGDVIMVDSLYGYNSIVIEGDSDENTGELHFTVGDEIRVFKYNDLIVCGDKVVYPSSDKKWNSVTILDNTEFELTNFLHANDGEVIEIDNPCSFDEITVDGSGEIIFHYEETFDSDILIIEDNEGIVSIEAPIAVSRIEIGSNSTLKIIADNVD
jgi:hypothetical protein